jgi:hypothetical protein
MTHTELLTRAAERCEKCAGKHLASNSPLYIELLEDAEAIRLAIKKLAKKEAAAKAGAIPTLKEVVEYGVEISLPEKESHRAWDHYQSNGWKVGKNPLKDWKAAMRNWKRGWAERNPGAVRSMATGKPNLDQEGWSEWLRKKNITYRPYGQASGWMREEFAKGGGK